MAIRTGPASSFVKERIANIKLAMYLEMFTIVGAIVGATITVLIAPVFLCFLFAAFLLTSFVNFRSSLKAPKPQNPKTPKPQNPNMGVLRKGIYEMGIREGESRKEYYIREMKKDTNEMERCKEHNKQYEMFCFEGGCKGEELPMCSMCMCEHIKRHHVKGARHVTSLVQERLADVAKVSELTKKQQDQIKTYHTSAEEYLKVKDKVKRQLEEKLENLLAFYTRQKGLASDNNSSILQSNENILKALKKCEHKIKEKINDPNRVERKVKQMIEEHNYWLAYVEVNRALVEDSQLNDQEVKAELEKCELLTKAYEKQLADLDITPVQIAEYKSMNARNAELTQQNGILAK